MTKRYDPVATAVDKMVPYQEQGISLDDLRRALPKGRDKEINRFVSFFQSGDKERKQGPSIDGIPRYQHYLDGMINLVIDVETSRASKTGEIEGRGAFVYNIIKFDSRFAARMNDTASQVVYLDDSGEKKQQVVLIPVVDFPDHPERLIAVPKGFYCINDEAIRPLKGAFYRRVGEGGYAFFPRIFSRECILSVAGVGSPFQASPTAIQGGSQVENDIPCGQRKGRIDILSTDAQLPLLKIETKSWGILVSLDKLQQIRGEHFKVFFGPIDLPTSVLER